MARQTTHCVRDERLQVEDNILVFKKNQYAKEGRTLH